MLYWQKSCEKDAVLGEKWLFCYEIKWLRVILTSSQVSSSSPSVTDIQSDTSDPNIVYVRKPNSEEGVPPSPNHHQLHHPDQELAGEAAGAAAGLRHSCFLGMVVSTLVQTCNCGGRLGNNFEIILCMQASQIQRNFDLKKEKVFYSWNILHFLI